MLSAAVGQALTEGREGVLDDDLASVVPFRELQHAQFVQDLRMCELRFSFASLNPCLVGF